MRHKEEFETFAFWLLWLVVTGPKWVFAIASRVHMAIGRSQFNSTYSERGWEKWAVFMRSSWCLSLYVQLFSYNFKLCVFLFAPFGILEMSTYIFGSECQVSFFRGIFSFEMLKMTFFLFVSLIPHWHISVLLLRQWHRARISTIGRKIYFNTGSENENNENFVKAKISVECRKSLISFLSLPSDKINFAVSK